MSGIFAFIPISCLLASVVTPGSNRRSPRASNRVIAVSLFSQAPLHIVSIAMGGGRLVRQSFVYHPLPSGAAEEKCSENDNNDNPDNSAQCENEAFEGFVTQKPRVGAAGGLSSTGRCCRRCYEGSDCLLDAV